MIIENEKIAIEEKLKIQEQTAKQFEHEKQLISDTALSLKANLEVSKQHTGLLYCIYYIFMAKCSASIIIT